MTRRAVLILALLVLTPLLGVPQAGAQNLGPVDVSVGYVSVRPDAVINQTVRFAALINSTGFAIVRVEFRYADGSDLKLDPVPQQSSYVYKNFTQAGSEEVALDVRLPYERRGQQEIVVTARVQGAGDANPANDTFRLPVFFRHPKLNLTFEEPPSLNVVPQGERHLRYFVRNEGNSVDNATAVMHLDGDFWHAEHYGALPTLQPGQSVTGHLVARPVRPGAGANLSLNLSVFSQVGGEGAARAQAPALMVNESAYTRRPAVALEGVPSLTQIFAGETRGVNFTLRNTGNVSQLYRVNATLDGAPAGWSASFGVPDAWPANLSRPANLTSLFPVVLEPGEAMPLLVNVSRGATAQNATATLRLEVNSTEGDQITALVGGAYRALGSVRFTDAGPDLAVNVTEAPAVVYQFDTPRYRVEVRNAGRANATNSTLHVELRDNLRTLQETDQPVPRLAPGESHVVEWSPSTGGLRGNYALLARVVPNATQPDRNPANDTARVDVHIRAPGIAVRAPETLRAAPGGRITLTAAAGGLSVENLGDREETYLVRLESDTPWLRQEWRITTPPGGISTIPLTLDVPAMPGTLRAEGTLTALIEGRERFTASATMTVEVDDVDPPALTAVSPEGPTRAGEPTLLAVRATDAGGIRRADVVLRTPDGQRFSLPLAPDATLADTWSTTYTPQTAGEHGLEFRVEDRSATSPGVASLNRTWLVRGGGYAGLRAVNFGEDAHVGRTPLRLAEVAPDTTASVQVNVGEGFRPLVKPYDFELPEVEGPRLVHVRATAKDGTTWEQRWNVTVDLTPPQVAEPKAAPAGDRLELSVRAGDAREVRARFQTDNGPVDVTLTSQGSGVFGATVNPPGSWDSVTFLAKDQAGNEGSTVLDAQGGDETPGPGLLATLAVLAALGLALRRRRT